MKLTMIERSTAFGLLPEKADFRDLKLLRVAKEGLSFTAEENEVIEITTKTLEDGRVMSFWNDEKAAGIGEVEIPLDVVVTRMIFDALEKLNKDKELEERHFTLYEKFVENAEEEK